MRVVRGGAYRVPNKRYLFIEVGSLFGYVDLLI